METKKVHLTVHEVPMEVDILNVGPAPIEKIKTLEEQIATQDTVEGTLTGYHPTLGVDIHGDERLSYLGERPMVEPSNQPGISNTERINRKLKEQSKDPLTLLVEISEIIQNIPPDKRWWESKTILVNASALITLLAARFGFDIQFTDQFYVIAMSAINLFNMLLRLNSNTGIVANENDQPHPKKFLEHTLKHPRNVVSDHRPYVAKRQLKEISDRYL